MNRLYSAFFISFLCLGLIFGCGGDSWTKKGKEFLAAGDDKSAAWYFQQAIAAKPTNAEAHYQLGLSYRNSGQHDSAIESFRTAAQLAPERVDVQLALGEVYMEIGHRKLASRIFLKVLQNSNSKDIIQTIARLTGDVYQKTRLTSDSVRAYSPSATDKRIAYTTYIEENNEIYVMDIDSKNQKRLTFDSTNDYSPCLSPDGTKIVYISFMRWRNSNDEIYIMDADGKNQTRLTFNVYSDGNPTFSPNGKLIAFESNREGNSEIYIMDVDGQNQRRLTFAGQTSSAVTRCYCPSFSPDGSQIVFSAYSIESSEEKTLSSESSALKTNTAKEDESSVADSDLYNVVSQIYVVGVNGKNLRQLTNVKAINSNPSFSPDGKKIVFDSNRNIGKFGESNSGIYIMEADGKNQMRLTGDEYISMEPVFTPDGKKIVFTGQKADSDNLGIYIMDLEQPFTKEELIKRLKGL
ncbi:tetratricopeptide repeat protein [Candidatus Poribacteria bacterium]|nr:tetratricopeptide repeat protein [Candidatus Poribacteria bacterium]